MPSPAFLSGKPYGKVLFAAIDEYLYALGVPQNFYLLDAAAVAKRHLGLAGDLYGILGNFYIRILFLQQWRRLPNRGKQILPFSSFTSRARLSAPALCAPWSNGLPQLYIQPMAIRRPSGAKNVCGA